MQSRFEKEEEKFLDLVFDYESKLDQSVWESNVLEHGSWMFSARQIRNKICLDLDRRLVMAAIDRSQRKGKTLVNLKLPMFKDENESEE